MSFVLLRRLTMALGVLLAVAPLSAAPRLHLAGDSTMATKERRTPNPEYGWGEMLPRYFADPEMVVNHAANGRSTKSFRELGHWEKLRAALQPGDWVILQFGHNDGKKDDPARYTAPRGDYERNLRRFIAEIRAAGAHPILATSVARRAWDRETGHIRDTHGDYLVVTREVAASEDVPLLELFELTRALEEAHGIEGSKRLHLWIEPGLYARKAEGWRDNTHYSAYGADRVAALVVQEIIRLGLSLRDSLSGHTRPDLPARPPEGS